jgi:uncharacterized membrane protein YphA (DoxX/SURF4 family)
MMINKLEKPKNIIRNLLRFIVKLFGNSYTILFARLLLGVVFILAAIWKIPESAKFVEEVTGLGLLPWKIADAYAKILPWLELTVGTGLILGLISRLAAGISILMVISFLVANGTSIWVYEQSYCAGCFGMILVPTSSALGMDIIMLTMAIIIIIFGGRQWSLDSLIRRRKNGN